MRTLLIIAILFALNIPNLLAQPGMEKHREPFPVFNVDNPVHQAIQVQTGWAGPLSTNDIYKVPGGHALVIEFVTFSATAEIWDCRLTTTVKGTLCSHFLTVHPQSKKGEAGVVSQMVKIYADPGSTVGMWARTAPNNTGTVTISGYLVPL